MGSGGFSPSWLGWGWGWGGNLARHTSFVPRMKGENGLGVWESWREAGSTHRGRSLRAGSGSAHQLFDETRPDRDPLLNGSLGLSAQSTRQARSDTLVHTYNAKHPTRVRACFLNHINRVYFDSKLVYTYCITHYALYRHPSTQM